VYFASAVINSIRGNNALAVFGLDLAACPVQSCVNAPEECSKGQAESCEKKVEIVYEHDGHNKLVQLVFRYQLNGSGREGFIREDDFSLRTLIKRRIIVLAETANRADAV